MISIILIEPKEPGNIGAIARAMANFDLKQLILINPKCNHLCSESKNRAVHAQNILKNTKIENISKLNDFDYLIGTTSLLGSDYNIKRLPISPGILSKKISKKSKVAIVFGRESSGLTNKEIEMCDVIVSIPTSKTYHAVNISHAASIIFYEIYKESNKENITEHIKPAGKEEKEVIFECLKKILNNLEFSTPEKKETQNIVWKRILSKAMPTKREAFAIIGLLKKIVKKLDR